MGGGGGRSSGLGDIGPLIDKAREELQRAREAGRANVFLSFASEDLDEVNLLRGQAKSEKSDIEFNDWSVREPFNSSRAAYIKQKIGERIAQSSLTVVYLSNASARSDWVKWEIEESLNRGKRVIGVHKGDSPPNMLPKIIKANKIKVVPWSKLADEINR